MADATDTTALVVRVDDLDGFDGSTLVVVDVDTLARRDELVRKIDALGDVTAGNLLEADALALACARHNRAVEKMRTTCKRPFLEGGRIVDRLAAQATVAETVADAVFAERQRQERVRREAQAVADRAAAAAAAERARLDEEARRVMQAAAELEATAATPDDVAIVRATAASDLDRIAAAEDRVLIEAGRAYLHATEVAGAPLPKTATQTVKRMEVEIVNPAAVPHELNGEQLVTFNLPAIRRLLDAGVDVPGCRLVEREHGRVGR